MSAFTMEKTVVFAPMDSDKVMMTVTVKPGLRHNWRAANLRFCPKASIDDPPGETAGIWRFCLPYVDVPEEVPLQQRTWPSAAVTRARNLSRAHTICES